jgi:hypothetical protein
MAEPALSYHTGMPQRSTSASATSRKPGKRGVAATETSDELAVRAYLRVLVGAPVRSADKVGTVEGPFVKAVGRWSERKGVDRRTLARIGVKQRVLEASGLEPTPVSEVVRRHYGKQPFTVADIARLSGVSAASVRKTVYEDESKGLVEEVEATSRALLFRAVR